VDIHRSPDAHLARARLAFVPDNPVLYEDLTVLEHLELLGLAHGALDDLDDRAEALLGELELLDRQGFLPTQLSRGMRQKAQIACALIRPFAVIVLDEPVVGLDPPSQARLKEILIQAKDEGAGVLVTTHQLDFARGVADRAVILSGGKVVAEGQYEAVVDGERAAALGLR
jgi:ABC-2 type transport system ATP-binding protein